MGLDLVQAVLVVSRTPRRIEMGVLGGSRDPDSAEQTRRECSRLEADEDHRRVFVPLGGVNLVIAKPLYGCGMRISA